jgi:hypothetical protein
MMLQVARSVTREQLRTRAGVEFDKARQNFWGYPSRDDPGPVAARDRRQLAMWQQVLPQLALELHLFHDFTRGLHRCPIHASALRRANPTEIVRKKQPAGC